MQRLSSHRINTTYRTNVMPEINCTELPEALPGYPSLPGASIAVKLRQREASAPFFRDLHAVLAATAASFEEPGLRPLAQALLPPTALDMGVTLIADSLTVECRLVHCLSLHNLLPTALEMEWRSRWMPTPSQQSAGETSILKFLGVGSGAGCGCGAGNGDHHGRRFSRGTVQVALCMRKRMDFCPKRPGEVPSENFSHTLAHHSPASWTHASIRESTIYAWLNM